MTLRKNKIYRFSFHFEKLQLARGEYDISGVVQFQIIDLDRLKRFQVPDEQGLQILINYQISDLLEKHTEDVVGFEIIEHSNIFQNQITVNLRRNFPSMGLELIDVELTEIYFWGSDSDN